MFQLGAVGQNRVAELTQSFVVDHNLIEEEEEYEVQAKEDEQAAPDYFVHFYAEEIIVVLDQLQGEH